MDRRAFCAGTTGVIAAAMCFGAPIAYGLEFPPVDHQAELIGRVVAGSLCMSIRSNYKNIPDTQAVRKLATSVRFRDNEYFTDHQHFISGDSSSLVRRASVSWEVRFEVSEDWVANNMLDSTIAFLEKERARGFNLLLPATLSNGLGIPTENVKCDPYKVPEVVDTKVRAFLKGEWGTDLNNVVLTQWINEI